MLRWHYVEPLRIGDLVFCEDYSRKPGTIVECLNEDYVRVLWEDASQPTTHRGSTLALLCHGAPMWH